MLVSIKMSDIKTHAAALLDILSVDRASRSHARYQVGEILHDIDDQLVNVWLNFCKRTNKNNYCEMKRRDQWKDMDTRKGHYTIASLHYFAAIDNPEAYAQYIAHSTLTLTNL